MGCIGGSALVQKGRMGVHSSRDTPYKFKQQPPPPTVGSDIRVAERRPEIPRM
jgi:hypothetical protein